MSSPVIRSPDAAGEPRPDDLDAFVHAITAVESIVAGWDEAQVLTVQALKSAIEDFHKEALQRLIRALKDDPSAGARLRAALADPVVYGVLRFHGLIRAPLAERLNLALEEVRPSLASHGGGVELVAIKPPDTVELRLIGSCHGCPASGQTLSEGVEKAIRTHCPEILHINQVSRAAPEAAAANPSTVHFISPFALHAKSGWLDAGIVADIPEGAVVERQLKGRSLLLSKRGEQISCFDNACAHLGMPLDMGEVRDGVITCSYHGFKYLLETGECLTAPEVQLKVHAVRVTGQRVQVRLEE
ncbi:MAG TPA: NifU family protein [Steroidobacteraceae bacterium]|jgi:nitrite reductase/ring-hydroxylating ferredoxin subunit/Fe-S cluster biogenesis protein NfuA